METPIINRVNKNIDKKTISYIRYGFMALFLIFFLISIGYWMYELYQVYEDPVLCINSVDIACDINDLSNIYHSSVHELVAFQAAILSFLLFVAAYKL
jgi:hypothetical protein|tara:strand:+ start:5059 stop:5352 length:294 start_codon:yes stop_codon:yes gene_type:complete